MRWNRFALAWLVLSVVQSNVALNVPTDPLFVIVELPANRFQTNAPVVLAVHLENRSSDPISLHMRAVIEDDPNFEIAVADAKGGIVVPKPAPVAANGVVIPKKMSEGEITLSGNQMLTRYVDLTRLFSLPVGRYTVTVRYRGRGFVATSEAAAFEIVKPE